MSSIPLMWLVWCACFLVFIVFRVYVYRVSRNADDQLVLQESSAHVRVEQEAIAARIAKTRPAGLVILCVFGAATLYVAGYYLLDIVRQFQ